MYKQLPSLTKCCFCVPLRYGILAWAYIRLVFSIFVAGCTLLTLSVFEIFMFYTEVTTYMLILIVSPLMLFFFDIVFNFVLIVGCHKKHTTLLRLYFRFGIAYAVVFVIFYVTIVAFKSAIASKIHSDTSDTWNFITIFSSFCGTLLILHMYLLLMVRSEIVRLKQPSSQFQFVNRIAVPSRIKQVDSMSTDKKKVISSEKPLPPELTRSKSDWLYIDNKNFSI